MLQSLSLIGYRNIKDLHFSFEKQGVLFVGKNGQGKTNILEAIYALSIGRPFRLKNSYDAIHFDDEAFHIIAKTDDGILEMHAATQPRKQMLYKVHDVKKKFFDFLGNFHAVLFSPEDIQVIRGAPSLRRSELDALLIRLDKEYAYSLQKYEQTLRQRNALLKQIQAGDISRDNLVTWDALLDEHAQLLWEKRSSVCETLIPLLQKFYKDISGKDESIEIHYIQKRLSDDFIADLQSRYDRDIAVGSTSLGPHRDEIEFFLRGKNASEFASQGETRSLVLALKYAEVSILEDFYNTTVVLLLDDVFSELDEYRQKALLDLTKNRQTFITTTHIDTDLAIGELFYIQNGSLERMKKS